jgi:hypothetical protein
MSLNKFRGDGKDECGYTCSIKPPGGGRWNEFCVSICNRQCDEYMYWMQSILHR